MKIGLNPLNKALLAGIIMIVALVAIAFVVVDDYAVSLPPGEVDEFYSSPAIGIRAASIRIEKKLDAYFPLNDIDSIYKERIVPVFEAPLEDDSDIADDADESVTEDPVVELKVTGIAWNSRNPVAFINGDCVRVGDFIGDSEIREITANSVLFYEKNGEYKQILLYASRNSKDTGKRPKGADRVKSGKSNSDTIINY